MVLLFLVHSYPASHGVQLVDPEREISVDLSWRIFLIASLESIFL